VLSVEMNVPPTPLFQGGGAEIVREEAMGATEFSVNLLQQTIVPLTPIDRGMLRNGMQTAVYGDRVDEYGRVFNLMPHALPVETGTVPHFPPVAALEAWAVRKLGQEGLGYVIARAISRRGTQGAFMFRRGLEACRDRIMVRFDQALQAMARRLGGG
jgi:hypothetical protein